MTVAERVVALTTTYLPIDHARQALLPPVRLARAGAVVLATTVRHWELVLEGEDRPTAVPGRSHDDAGLQGKLEPAAHASASTDRLPVEDWAELSYADAQARLATCDADDLRTLLDYERSHGHRPQYTNLLEQRLADSA